MSQPSLGLSVSPGRCLMPEAGVGLVSPGCPDPGCSSGTGPSCLADPMGSPCSPHSPQGAPGLCSALTGREINCTAPDRWVGPSNMDKSHWIFQQFSLRKAAIHALGKCFQGVPVLPLQQRVLWQQCNVCTARDPPSPVLLLPPFQFLPRKLILSFFQYL